MDKSACSRPCLRHVRSPRKPNFKPPSPRATPRRAAAVRYDPGRDRIDIDLTDGIGIRPPKSLAAEFQAVPPDDMASIPVSPAGYGIRLDSHDIAISVHGLIAALATPGDMAAALGKLGGGAQSPKKRAASKANGAKGGRPRTGSTAT